MLSRGLSGLGRMETILAFHRLPKLKADVLYRDLRQPDTGS